MARRVNPAAGATATEEFDEATPLEGGSLGAIPDAPAPMPHQVPVAPREPEPAGPPPTRYEVVGSRGPVPGYQVQQNGVLVLVRTGRVVSEASDDVDGLRRQGVVLRELPAAETRG